jgi:hypothetical protein
MPKPCSLLGNTALAPWLSRHPCRPGDKEVYRVLVEGKNCVYLGAMRNHPAEGLDLKKGVFYNETHGSNEHIWCFCANNRKTYAAGTRMVEGRLGGPGTFEVPFTLEVTVDAAAGTLAVAVISGKGKEWNNETKQYSEAKDWSGCDLGVVIHGVPADAPLHLAVGTNDDSCKVTLL